MPLPIFDLDEIRLATPCSMKWEDMKGDDRKRFCQSCNKNVFNISSMGRNEAIDFIRATEGPLCVRFYKRKDGTVLTSDCPVGLALVARRAKRFALGTAAASIGMIAAVLAVLAAPAKKTCSLPPQPTHETTTVVEKLLGVKKQIEIKKDELIVPEHPMENVAGGLRAPTPEELGQMPATR